jgi:hypothetical protein
MDEKNSQGIISADNIRCGEMNLKDITVKGGMIMIPPSPKSVLWIGGKYYKTSLPVYQHFNWFQKLMWKLFFGIKVEDYSGE